MKIRTAIILFALLLSGCLLPDREPPEEPGEPESIEAVTEIELELDLPLPPASDWYVATTGDNANSCATPEEPCLTLEGAYAKSSTSDRINLTAGTYLGADGTGELLPVLTHSIIIRGAGSTLTIIDANNNDDGWTINRDNHLYLEGLTLRNTAGVDSSTACLETLDSAGILAQDVVLQSCWKAGIIHNSTGLVDLQDVVIAGTLDQGLITDLISGGVGIVNRGELIMQRGAIRDNASSGVSNFGPLAMTGTTIEGNQGHGLWHEHTGESYLNDVTINNNGTGLPGAGIFIETGILNVNGSTISANGQQSGVWVSSSTVLNMDTSTISDQPGSGLYVELNGMAELTDVTLEDNGSGPEFGPAIANDGTLTVRDSHIINNLQGALRNLGIAEIYDTNVNGNSNNNFIIDNALGSLADLHIERSLIANNTTTEPFSAALSNAGLLTIINSTVSNNSHDGLSLNTEATLSYVTIAENGLAGLRTGGEGPFTVENTLIARNNTDCEAFLEGYGTLLGLNIDTDGTCAFPETYTPDEIRLGGLADNGGPTFTHELLRDPDSPAIDTATGPCPSEDQRGSTRPIGPGCDVGAYEAGGVPLSAPDPGFILGTPTPEQPGTITVITTVPCFGGPGPGYVFHSTLQQGNNLELIGAGFTGGANDAWVVARHPAVPNTSCWIPTQDISTTVPFSEMKLITIPSLPTATPEPDDGEKRDPDDPDAPQEPAPPKPTCNFAAPCP